MVGGAGLFSYTKGKAEAAEGCLEMNQSFVRWIAAFLLSAFLSLGTPGAVQAALTNYTTTQTLSGLFLTGGTSFSISGGVITVNGSIVGGDGGTLSISNATVTQGSNSTYNFGAGYNANATTGYINVGNGGVLNIGNGGALTFIGGGNSGAPTGIGVLTLSGSGMVNIGAAGSGVNNKVYLTGYGGSGTVNLSGGTLTTSRPITGTGAASYFYASSAKSVGKLRFRKRAKIMI
jgi:hypothetical protein